MSTRSPPRHLRSRPNRRSPSSTSSKNVDRTGTRVLLIGNALGGDSEDWTRTTQRFGVARFVVVRHSHGSNWRCSGPPFPSHRSVDTRQHRSLSEGQLVDRGDYGLWRNAVKSSGCVRGCTWAAKGKRRSRGGGRSSPAP